MLLLPLRLLRVPLLEPPHLGLLLGLLLRLDLDLDLDLDLEVDIRMLCHVPVPVLQYAYTLHEYRRTRRNEGSPARNTNASDTVAVLCRGGVDVGGVYHKVRILANLSYRSR